MPLHHTDTEDEDEDDELFQEHEGNAQEEDEDMVRREEELRAELNFATTRVEELKRTLQETKSYLGPRLPTRGTQSKVAVGAAAAAAKPQERFEEAGDDEEEDDDFYMEEDEEEDCGDTDEGVSTC